MNENKSPEITLFPEERLSPYFPFQLWAIGWLGILKSCIWIFTDPAGLQEPLTVMGIRYLIMTTPFFIFSVGIFNKKKWAVWGIGVTAILEILFFLAFRETLSTLVLDHLTTVNLIFSVVIFIINGPMSDVLILVTVPFILRFTRN